MLSPEQRSQVNLLVTQVLEPAIAYQQKQDKGSEPNWAAAIANIIVTNETIDMCTHAGHTSSDVVCQCITEWSLREQSASETIGALEYGVATYGEPFVWVMLALKEQIIAGQTQEPLQFHRHNPRDNKLRAAISQLI